MCKAAIIITGLDRPLQDLLRNAATGRPFGLAVLNKFGGVPVVRQLQVLKLARQMPNEPQYGRPQWILTTCGLLAGRLLLDLEANPLLRDAILADYGRAIKNCPDARKTNPFCTCNL